MAASGCNDTISSNFGHTFDSGRILKTLIFEQCGHKRWKSVWKKQCNGWQEQVEPVEELDLNSAIYKKNPCNNLATTLARGWGIRRGSAPRAAGRWRRQPFLWRGKICTGLNKSMKITYIRWCLLAYQEAVPAPACGYKRQRKARMQTGIRLLPGSG